MTKSQREKIEAAAKAEAHYFSNIQFPVQFVEVGNQGIKQDVNYARRVTCYNHHSWGFIKGAEFALKMLVEENQANAKAEVWSRERDGSGV